MSQPPLTQQERDVLQALSIGRPKRYLHVYLMMGVGVLFLTIACYKAATRSSDMAARVAERPGPKAAAQEPPAAALKELIAKQSRGSAASPAAFETRPSLVSPALQLPAPDRTTPSAPVPMDLGKNLAAPSPRPLNELPSDLDRKLAEASYMTAKTDIYVQSTPSAVGAEGAGVAPIEELATPDVRRTRGGADTLDPGRLAGAAKPTVDERIIARGREQQSFAASANSSPRVPLHASEIPEYLFVAEGTMIPAVITRALASHLPGQIEARVVSDVFDSAGRGRVLIPKGSRITGLYNSVVAVGQERLQVAFTRIIFPSGASVALENSAASDLAGRSGVPGQLDNHFARIFGSALAIGMLSYAVERRAVRDATSQGSGTAVNVYGGSATTPGTVAAQVFANVSNQILDRNLSIGPTITVPAGQRIQVQVARDLAIDPGKVL